jgi:hypothetical protein
VGAWSLKDASPPPEVDEDDWLDDLPEAEANDKARSGEPDGHFIDFIKAIWSSRPAPPRRQALFNVYAVCMQYENGL